tara:strand:- start:933 stop:1508 length:576 start_codon:yes stop_codon:yes gene_type:complete
MQSPTQFIIKPKGGRRYDNITKYGDIEFITSSSQEDHKVTNRYGIVIATPIGYEGEISPGDTLLVHHNVFKIYYDMKGREKSGPCHFRNDIFMVEPDQFFLYKKGDKWKTHSRYCFVRPMTNENCSIFNMNIENNNHLHLVGEVVYSNKELDSLGIKEGDIIGFQPHSEYEFKIEGEILYRMFTKNICIKI